MRVIQIGTGFWGSGWARVVSATEGWELATLVDVNEEALQQAADSVGLPSNGRFARLGDALSAVEADAALIVVPPEEHVAVALEALDAGLHCLIEKPFAPSLEEAQRVVDQGVRVGRKVMVCQNLRYTRGPQTVKRLIHEGAVGRIESVNVYFSKAPRFGGFREEMDEPLIVDLAIHHFDLIRGIVGLEPVRVRAHSYNPSWSWFRGNACALVQFETADGAIVSYSGSWVSRAPDTSWHGNWDIQGDEGAVQWKYNRVELVPSNFGVTVFRQGALERGNGVMEVPLLELAAEERAGTLAEFAAAVAADREPETSGLDNMRSLALVLGAVESTRSGDWVDLA